jgi:hypothetical protein
MVELSLLSMPAGLSKKINSGETVAVKKRFKRFAADYGVLSRHY